ncbi:pyrroline-5-carboxylate reductase [uncultured Ruminococcus sp.]|uniref:pyrroline-5-carboxylate reductase n=2 Tax=Ruminococcus TaxID=1263 RepID=UPI00265E9FBD|nr:pyrroline-5-carboxylate reductase [uncultured Ruminococcus sp.]
MNTIGFLGTGNMGTAILKGIAGSSMKSETKLYAYNPTAAKVDALASYGVQKCSSEAEVAAASQYLFLAIKPQKFDEVLPRIADAITEDTVLVSIAAGIGVEYIRKLTKPNAKIVLAMPNTPLLLGCGATALATEAPVSDAEFAVVRRIFDACGMTAVIEPAQMKEIIAINGSSPAFIYLFAKGFLDYAEQVGLSGDVAKELFAQSLIGSAKMITDSGYSIAELIRQVSSPGGTTLAGLDRFYAGNLTDVVQDACDHCTRRAYELAK